MNFNKSLTKEVLFVSVNWLILVLSEGRFFGLYVM